MHLALAASLGRRYSKTGLPEFTVRFLVFFAVFCCFASAQTPAHFYFTGQPGPHGVGLKVVEQYDYSRTFHPPTDALGKPYAGERARPIQTLILYPAEHSRAKK